MSALIGYTRVNHFPMNANDSLREHTSTDNYYKYGQLLLITDGVKALCEQFQCYWFLDVIGSYQPQPESEDFQVWSLGKNDDSSAVVLCTDGNDRVLVSQQIEYTDFNPTEATVWVEGNVALLPSEH